MIGSDGIDIQAHARIDAVDPVEWDSFLAPNDLQATHRFVKLCQESEIENANYRHVMLSQGGKLAAVACFSQMIINLDVLAPPKLRNRAGVVRQLMPWFMRVPMVFCGLPVSFGQSCLRFSPGADRAAAVRALAIFANELGEELNTGMLCFKEFNTREKQDLDELTGAGFLRLPSLPSNSMKLRWNSFEAYLSNMRAGYRRQARLDREAAGRWQIRVRKVTDFSNRAAELHRLYQNVIDHTDFVLERLPQAFFEKLGPSLGENVSALYLEHDDDLVGFAILLNAQDTLTFLLAGIDHNANLKHHLHPLLVSEVIAEAIRIGAKNIELGQTAYALKGRFGARTEERFLYMRHRSLPAHRLLRVVSNTLFPERQMSERRVFRFESLAAI